MEGLIYHVYRGDSISRTARAYLLRSFNNKHREGSPTGYLLRAHGINFC